MARRKKDTSKGKVRLKKKPSPTKKGGKAQQAKEPEGKKAGSPKGSSSKDSQSLVRIIKKMIRLTNQGVGEVDTLKKRAESLISNLKRKSSRSKYTKMVGSIMGRKTTRAYAGATSRASKRPKDLTYKGVVKEAGGKARVKRRVRKPKSRKK